jgi:hypothetical protein
MALRAVSFPRGFRRARERAAWISRSTGFLVETSTEELGTVEEVRFIADGKRPTQLAVRGRAFGSRPLLLVDVDDVVKILPEEKRLVVRGRRLPLRLRVLSSAAFGATAASFLLPFLTVTLERRAEATGIDLVANTPSFSGSYVHASYVGDVELLVGDGHFPALIAFALALVGVAGAWLPARKGVVSGVLAALLGLIGMWALWSATTGGPQLFASSDHRYGFWVAGGLFLCSGAISLLGARALRAPG